MILTRIPVLSFGVRAYVDIPYVALVLGAILAEARGRGTRCRSSCSPSPGLLRPEAWLFSFAYVAWQARPAAAAAAPPPRRCCGWSHDLLARRRPAALADRHARQRRGAASGSPGLDDVPLTVPRRLGEILREPGLLGAAAGGILVLAFMRRRAALPIAAGFVSIAAFCVLAAAGLPILGRYLLLPAALLAVFCGAGVFGWLRLPRDHPWRTRWAAIGGVVLAAFVVFAPGQADRIGDLRASMGTQSEILADLHDITRRRSRCRAGRGPEPPPGPAHRALDRHPAGRDRLRAARAADARRLPRPRERARAAQLHARPARPEAADRGRPAAASSESPRTTPGSSTPRCQAYDNATG